MKKFSGIICLLVLTLELAAADPSITQGTEIPSLKESGFSRVSLSGDRLADVIRLMDPQGDETGKVVVVENGTVRVVPDTEITSMRTVDGPTGVEVGPIKGTVSIRFGQGVFSRVLKQTGRVASFKTLLQGRELWLQYVSIPGVKNDDIMFVVAWRLLVAGKLRDAGEAMVPVTSSKEATIALKAAGESMPFAEARIQFLASR